MAWLVTRCGMFLTMTLLYKNLYIYVCTQVSGPTKTLIANLKNLSKGPRQRHRNKAVLIAVVRMWRSSIRQSDQKHPWAL